LARGFLGVTELPADLERLVATRAEGNPFFIEELLQALLELGSLAVVDGTAVLAKVEVEIPDTVQGTILARVDRLDQRTRSVLQHAAVLGRGSTTELLEAVVGDGTVAGDLAALARAQLVVTPAPGEWSFKHALIQEVTYETLLLRNRRDLHEKVARALEDRAGDDPTLLEALAEHYAKAEAPEKARRYALAAGDRDPRAARPVRRARRGVLERCGAEHAHRQRRRGEQVRPPGARARRAAWAASAEGAAVEHPRRLRGHGGRPRGCGEDRPGA